MAGKKRDRRPRKDSATGGSEHDPTRGASGGARDLIRAAGVRYWTASVLPALLGTALPFWLRPSGFAFNRLGALELILAAVLLHAGLSLLHARYRGLSIAAPSDGVGSEGSVVSTGAETSSRFIGAAVACVVAAGIIGLHLNTVVPGNIFLVLGLGAVFAGVIYVAPPFSFSQRVGGEVVIAVGLGLLPVLGGYLVQVGDLTRTVYLASLPLVFATALWVWTSEMVDRVEDEKAGRCTTVVMLGSRLSGRLVVPVLAVLVYASLFLAVFTASMIPLALVAVLTFGLARTVVAVSWHEHASSKRMIEARLDAFKFHLATGIIAAASMALAAVGS